MAALGTCRRKFSPPRTLTRCLKDLPHAAVSEILKKKAGDIIVCPPLLGATCNTAVTQSCLTGNVEEHVVLTISKVTEGLELFHLSQYPMEEEVLLPMLAMMKVVDVRREPGQPINLLCVYKGTVLSSKIQAAILADLGEASYYLVTGLDPKSKEIASTRKPAPDPLDFGQYTPDFFRSLCDLFSAADRRQIWVVTVDDFNYIYSTMGKTLGYTKPLAVLFSYFSRSSADLSLQQFITLAMKGAPLVQVERALRWACRHVRRSRAGPLGSKEEEASGPMSMSPSGPMPMSPSLRDGNRTSLSPQRSISPQRARSPVRPKS